MRHRHPRLLALVTACAALGLGAGHARAWTTDSIPDTGFTGLTQDQNVAIATDQAGNVVVAGAADNAGGGYDFVVVKLGALDGAELWRYVLPNGTATNSKDGARAVAVAPNGDVVAVGRAEYSDTKHDFVVVKLNGATGAEAWPPVRVNAAVNGSDLGAAVAVDGAGDIVAAGFTQTQLVPVRFSFTVVKVAGADGAELWRRADIAGDGASNQGRAIAVDADGDAVAAGFLQNAATGTDLVVVKLAGDTGASRWATPFTIAGPGDDEATAVALDAVGNVVVAGSASTDGSSTDTDIVVAKLNADSGALVWPAAVMRGGTGSDAPADTANAVAVDAAGNVLVAGSLVDASPDGDTTTFAVLKLRSDGTEAWMRTLVGTAAPNFASQASAVVADLAGNAVAAGRLENTASDFSLVVVNLNALDGVERWRTTVEGNAGENDDEATAVALDSSGDVAAAGRRDVTTGREFVALRVACNGAANPVDCTGLLPDDCTFGGGCDPDTGQCSTGPRPDGSPCNDEDACTQDDACQAGTCGGEAVVCGGQCRAAGECDPATGACNAPALPDGTPCDDADACTTSDACRAGICVAPGPEVVPCALDGAVGGAACAGQKLPRGAKRNLKKAKKLVPKAVGQANPTKRAKLLAGADGALTKAGNAVAKAASRARKPLPAACAQAIAEAIVRAKAAIAGLGQ